jgi:hypothetical protein
MHTKFLPSLSKSGCLLPETHPWLRQNIVASDPSVGPVFRVFIFPALTRVSWWQIEFPLKQWYNPDAAPTPLRTSATDDDEEEEAEPAHAPSTPTVSGPASTSPRMKPEGHLSTRSSAVTSSYVTSSNR